MRLIKAAVLGVVAGSLLLAGTQAGAAPTRTGTVLEFECGDADVRVLVTEGGGNKSWSVDDSSSADGTTFHLKEFEIRIYAGSLAEEPAGVTPLFVGSHSYGQRVGQGST